MSSKPQSATAMPSSLKLAGWRYIRCRHGDLYGVGWDRAQQKAEEALAASPPAPSQPSPHHGSDESYRVVTAARFHPSPAPDGWQQERERLRSALEPILALPPECVDALTHKRQIDEDGDEVGVSHQAVDEIHTALVSAREALASSPPAPSQPSPVVTEEELVGLRRLMSLYDRVHGEMDAGKTWVTIDHGLTGEITYGQWLAYVQQGIVINARAVLSHIKGSSPVASGERAQRKASDVSEPVNPSHPTSQAIAQERDKGGK